MVEAHVRDGAALAHFYAWLRRTVRDEGRALSEVQIATKLAEFRRAQV